MTKPRKKTLRNVIEYLEENGISLYGTHMDFKTGQEYPSLADYDLEGVLARIKHIEKGTLKERELTDG